MERMTRMLRAADHPKLLSDGLLALALTVFAQLDLRFNIDQSIHYGPGFAAAVTTAVATSAIALRRRAPLLTVCTVAAAVAGPELVTRLTITLWGSFVPLLIALYSVARHARARVALAGAAVTALALTIVMLRVPVILLADDQALVRGGFRSILDGQDDIDVVGEASDGVEALDQAVTLNPDVILMDIRMPRLDGIEATRRLLSGRRAHTRVLMLTTFDHDEYVYEALRAGASGFLLKSAPPRELASALRTVAAGEALLAPEITRRMIEEYVRRPRPGDGRPRGLETLTTRELEVLGLIARGRSNAEIAAALFLSEPTIKTHVTRILAKLQLRDRVQAVVLAYECGLVQPGAS